MAGSAENTRAELDAFIEAGEARRIEQAGVVALLAAQDRDSRVAQRALHEIEEALAALRARRASLWAVSPT
jgi:NADH:ubiquinone oxidoreductase subunit E